ncbi:uncharacterized protein LOC124930317 [Impatiens glandulifera]|uniref:uncharacterized protein LOC124930317 n=1 Tax=Impatiens glandulifera TaxID=253017 RepID=UPI001FB110D4|nr:uncharacterized protein LOC124930317 [Impatiens glandulifera]
MWYVINDGPMKILKVSTAKTSIDGSPEMREKSRFVWTAEDKRKANLDNVTKDFSTRRWTRTCSTRLSHALTKEIWEKMTQLCEGNDQTKENKLMVATQKFDSIKMHPREIMTEFDERFRNIVIELLTLGKTYSNKEVVIKVMRALPKEWDIKRMSTRESKYLNKLELHDLFADLKTYEFEINSSNE